MDVDLIFRIAAVGILVAVLGQLLSRSGREEQALMTTPRGFNCRFDADCSGNRPPVHHDEKMYSGFDYGIGSSILRHCPCGAHAVAGAEKGRARYRVSADADGRGDFTFAGVQRGRKWRSVFPVSLAVRLGFRAVSAGVQGSRRGGRGADYSCALPGRRSVRACRQDGDCRRCPDAFRVPAAFEQVLDLITEWAV